MVRVAPASSPARERMYAAVLDFLRENTAAQREVR
jgi:hypothetical protein